MNEPRTIDARSGWLAAVELQALLAALSADGEEARVAGGAVRNALLGEAVADVDIATTCLPDDTIARATAAGFKTVPTGYDHGTVTVIAGGQAYEVTTLRADIETDGRHARVVFGRDWRRDAERRDFTINALYCLADGTIVDLVGGIADLESRTLRFIGDAEERIREDFLRILRFFRFFAWYGSGRPDAQGLKACARLKDGLAKLSAERVWSELKKLLEAPDPGRALLWMRQTGVLTAVLPESEKWGIDAVPALIAAERDLGWSPDPLLRLEAMVPPEPARMKAMADRLKLSNAETARLLGWAMAQAVRPETSDDALRRALYYSESQSVEDRLKLAWVSARGRAETDDAALAEAGNYVRLARVLNGWTKPAFPISGDDLIALGSKPGKSLGDVLRKLEAEWVDAGFKTQRDALLERAASLVAETSG